MFKERGTHRFPFTLERNHEVTNNEVVLMNLKVE